MATYGESSLNSSLARRYYRQMKAAYPAGAFSPQGGQPSAVSPLSDYINSAPSGGQQAENPRAKDPTNPATWLIDFISQPIYAMTETAKEAAVDVRKGGIGEIIRPDKSLGARLLGNFGSRNNKDLPSSLLRGDADTMNDMLERYGSDKRISEDVGPLASRETDNFAQKAAKATAGFVADVAFDPVTYLTLGAGGAALKAAGRGVTKAGEKSIGGQATTKAGAAVGGALEKGGQGAINLERKIDDAVSRGVNKVFPRTKPGTPVDSRPADPGAPRPAEDPLSSDFMRGLMDDLADGTSRTIEASPRMFDKMTGEVIDPATLPKNVRQNKRRQVETLPLDDATRERLKDIGIPFTKTPPQTARATPPVDRSIVEEMSQAFKAADEVPVAPKPLSPKEWVQQNSKLKIPVTIPGMGTAKTVRTETVATWIKLLKEKKVSPTTAKAVNAEINKTASAALRQQQGVAPAGPPTASAGNADGLAAAQGAPGPDGGSTPQGAVSGAERVETQQVIKDIKQSEDEFISGWTSKTPKEKANIRRRYREALGTDSQHYRHLYENQARKDWTDEEKAKDFISRLGQISRTQGLSTGTPRHIEFFEYQIVNKPTPKLSDDVAWRIDDPRKSQFRDDMAGVKSAGEIMDEADPSLEATRARQIERTLTGAELSDADRRILKETLTEQQWRAIDPEFKYRTDKQRTLRDSQIMGEGRGINREGFNDKAQQHMFQKLLEDVNAELNVSMKGESLEKARLRMRAVTTRLEAMERFMRANGVEPTFGTRKDGIPLSLGDAIRALSTTTRGNDFLLYRLFGGPQGLRYSGGVQAGKKGTKGTGVQGTVYSNMLLRTLGSVVASLDATTINAAKNGTDMYEAVARTVAGYMKDGKRPPPDQIKATLTENGTQPISINIPDPKGPKGARQTVEVPNETVSRELFETLFEATEHGKPDFRILTQLAQNLQIRSANYGIRFGDNVRELEDATMNRVFDFLDGNPSQKDVIDILGDPDKMVRSSVMATDIRPDSRELAAARAAIDEDLNGVLTLWDRQNVEAWKAISKATRNGESVPAASIKVAETASEQVDDILRKAGIEDVDMADVAKIEATGWMHRGFMNITDHMAAGMVMQSGKRLPQSSRIHHPIRNAEAMGRHLSHYNNSVLAHVNRSYPKQTIQAAYRFLQNGMQGQADEAVQAAAKEMRIVNDMFFDSAAEGTDGVLMDFFKRGFDLRHVQNEFTKTHFGLEDVFDWEAIALIKSPEDKVAALHKQWQRYGQNNADFDPLDFMSRMDKVMNRLATDMSMSQNAWIKMKQLGLVKTKPEPGLVRLTNTEASYITRYFPQAEGTYFVPKDLVPELKKMDKLLRETTDYGPGALGQAMKHYTPVFNMWRTGVTIYRPGHHMRNLVGDISLSYLGDGVKNPRYYYRAASMLGNRKQYDGVDMLRMLQGLPPNAQKHTGYNLTVRLAGGKKVIIDEGEFYESMYKNGIIKDFVSQEDLIESATKPGWAKKAEQIKPLGGKGRQVVGRVSEARDDFVRLAHALHLLENGPKNFKTQEELLQWVAARVNKFHPDGTDLTPFERKWMRPLFGFYSWMRKAIPLVIESGAQRPGRLLIAPKAMLNIAEQNGVDPDSLSNPFPDDQLFPSYMTDSITGPIYRGELDGPLPGMAAGNSSSYWAASPGMVDMDILNEFGTGKGLGSLLDSISPILKTPFELQFGKTVGAGIQTPGQDPAQYIGSQIPGLLHAQSLLGVDVLGSFGTLAQGEGLDPITSVQKGNRNQIEEQQFWNFLLGGGVRNQSTPSAINSAEIEARNRAAGR